MVNLDESTPNFQNPHFINANQPKTYEQQLHEAFADLMPAKHDKNNSKGLLELQKKKLN